MKTKLIAMIICVVVLFTTAIPASASVFTPSAEDKVAPTITVHTTQVGDYEVQDLDLRVEVMTQDYSDEYFADEFDTVIETVQAQSDIENLVGETDMLEPKVACLYYVVLSDDLRAALAANPEIVLEVTIENVGISSGVNVLGYVYKNENWNEVDTTNNNDNSVTIISNFCPLMLVVDSSLVESPNTNVSSINVFLVAAFACLFLAGGFYALSKRFKRSR